ncbi:MAG TPA: spermidine synthase, partial [Nitrospinaceae bacterium]|nr:spermidine synthase [Nitrospinaceae bacterium]
MGATLPVLSKFVSRDEAHIAKDVGTLYSINTFGAVFGAWSSAFVFMRLWGVQSTIWMTALLNLAIAAVIFLVFRPPLKEKGVAHDEGKSPTLDKREKLILLSFGLSGMVALVYQVAWNRILSLLLGSSVYAFSLILTVFILGLALGTASFSQLLSRFGDLMKVYGFTQITIGISSLLIIPLFGSIP